MRNIYLAVGLNYCVFRTSLQWKDCLDFRQSCMY